MTFNYDDEVNVKFKFDTVKLYEDVVLACLSAENCPYEVEVNLCLVDDKEIQEINKSERNIDKSTDVLSFPFAFYDEPSDFSKFEDDPLLFNPENGEFILGDIIISVDHVISQAEEYGHSYEREYAFLIIHSMLHLCGYDHIEENDRILMEARQKVILELLYDKYPILKVE